MLTCMAKRWRLDCWPSLCWRDKPRSVLHRVLGFATEVGLPITLAEIGLTELPKEDLQKIAVRATAEAKPSTTNRLKCEPDMVADAIMAADAMGRAWRKGHGPQ